ncbi:apolipoprotein N-acyltransferase [Ralstonia sp. UBA689]|uniref:apolipoprotein N-acyltransferase n=1 Tax=Ralstonia sp. UBA689 TaxID=1947373 RepID=UPI0025F66D9A|nr:apolipoprotein N-acyltransferase [Ralstonia sp. UBA689]
MDELTASRSPAWRAVARPLSLRSTTTERRVLPLLLAAACGAALALAFAPWSLRWAAAIGMVGVAVLFSTAPSPRIAGGIGLCSGGGLMAVGTTWIVHAIEGGASAAPWAVAPILAAFVLISALPYGLTCWLGARLVPLEEGSTRARIVRAALVLPAAWTLAEWLRGRGPLALPWMLTGTAHVPDGALASWMPVLGMFGTGWLAWTLAGGFACAGLLAYRRRWLAAMVAATLPLTVLGVSIPMANIAWTTPEPFALHVRLWQTNHPQGEKWNRAVAAATARELVDWVENAPRHSVLLTPELVMIDPWQMLPADWTGHLKAALAARDNTLLLGIPGADVATHRLFNTLTVIGPHAREAEPQIYLKERLAIFGETLPAKALLGWLYTRAFAWPLQDLSAPEPGENTPLLYADGHVLAGAICFETAFTRSSAQRDARAAFIANPSNDAWFNSTRYQTHALQITQAAALETGKPILRANNVGYTAVIRPDGSLQAVLPSGVAGELAADVIGHIGTTPFARVGEPLIIGICCAGLLLAWRLGPRRHGPTRLKNTGVLA